MIAMLVKYLVAILEQTMMPFESQGGIEMAWSQRQGCVKIRSKFRHKDRRRHVIGGMTSQAVEAATSCENLDAWASQFQHKIPHSIRQVSHAVPQSPGQNRRPVALSNILVLLVAPRRQFIPSFQDGRSWYEPRSILHVCSANCLCSVQSKTSLMSSTC